MTSRLRRTRLFLVPVLLLAVFSHHSHVEDSIVDTLLGATGLVLLVGAMAGRIWASAHVSGRKDRVLVTTGPYAFVRHPLYLFSLLGFFGAGLAFESLLLGATFTAVFFVSHWPEMRAEEERLATLFGDSHERYRERVPRLFPRPRMVMFGMAGPGPPASRRHMLVDLTRFGVAVRECAAIPLVFVVADLLEWAKLADLVPVLVHLP